MTIRVESGLWRLGGRGVDTLLHNIVHIVCVCRPHDDDRKHIIVRVMCVPGRQAHPSVVNHLPTLPAGRPAGRLDFPVPSSVIRMCFRVRAHRGEPHKSLQLCGKCAHHVSVSRTHTWSILSEPLSENNTAAGLHIYLYIISYTLHTLIPLVGHITRRRRRHKPTEY